MFEIDITSDELINTLLRISGREIVCFLDSCGVGHLGSHLLIAGIAPTKILEINSDDPARSMELFNATISDPSTASIFTISYDYGLKIQPSFSQISDDRLTVEPDMFVANFSALIVHDYDTGKTFLKGDHDQFDKIRDRLLFLGTSVGVGQTDKSLIESNFTKKQYIAAIQKIKEYINAGDTYQVNLTQQFTAKLPDRLSAQAIYRRLRDSHPAAFSAFLRRTNDSVVSISPERFIGISHDTKVGESLMSDAKHAARDGYRVVTASPIKGTRSRGETKHQDMLLEKDLLSSEKDRAENTMIVDLLRNDLGRICEFGSVRVEKLCELEIHPTLFHLVSTIRGVVVPGQSIADILYAVFPCGSITGCPKIRTMEIIEEIEPSNRGLSMGAIGYCDFDNVFDLSVAIRTLVIDNRIARFNVGGGIVSDSRPEEEYLESILKAKAIFNALNAS